jgi:cytidine deaminase
MTDEELIERARAVVSPRQLANGCTVGNVGCALVTEEGSLYVGVCIDAPSGMGFCAEHAAIASMVTRGEHAINKIVAVLGDGRVLPPCGRCREFMLQIDAGNMERTEVILGAGESVKLRELLPRPW